MNNFMSAGLAIGFLILSRRVWLACIMCLINRPIYKALSKEEGFPSFIRNTADLYGDEIYIVEKQEPIKRRILSEIGHLSNEDCGKAIVNILKAGIGKKISLGHLSNTNNHPDLAYQTVVDVLTANGVNVGSDVILSMANRHNPSEIIKL